MSHVHGRGGIPAAVVNVIANCQRGEWLSYDTNEGCGGIPAAVVNSSSNSKICKLNYLQTLRKGGEISGCGEFGQSVVS